MSEHRTSLIFEHLPFHAFSSFAKILLLQSRVTFKEENLLSVGQRQRAVTDDSSLGSFNVDLNEHDADIDEFSDGLTTQDDGGESTEPEHTENTLFFGQDDEMPRFNI